MAASRAKMPQLRICTHSCAFDLGDNEIMETVISDVIRGAAITLAILRQPRCSLAASICSGGSLAVYRKGRARPDD